MHAGFPDDPEADFRAEAAAMLRRLFPSTVPHGSCVPRARRVLRSATRVLTIALSARRGAQGYDDSPSPSKRPRAGWRDAL